MHPDHRKAGVVGVGVVGIVVGGISDLDILRRDRDPIAVLPSRGGIILKIDPLSDGAGDVGVEVRH